MPTVPEAVEVPVVAALLAVLVAVEVPVVAALLAVLLTGAVMAETVLPTVEVAPETGVKVAPWPSLPLVLE